MSIKILYVIDHMGLGGGQMSLKNTAENMNNSEMECIICALRSKKETISINAKVITLNYKKYDPRTIFTVAQLCKKYNIDIMHPQLSKSIITCLLASFICKVPLVIHERGGISMKGAFFFIYRVLLRLLHHRATAVIANSHATALELANKASIDQDHIKVIYNAIDVMAFNPEKVSRKQSRKNLKISDKDFVVGFVGRLHPMKGTDLLINAVSLLLKRSPHYLLVLAGDGPECISLETLASRLGITNRVRFLGMCYNVPEIMASFDIGVVPSRQEPFGRVAVEFMRMKVPVICSGVDGLGELVTDRITGVVTKENTPQNIADAIECLAEDKKLQKQLIDNAYKFSEKFNIDEHVRKIEKMYEAIINNKLR